MKKIYQSLATILTMAVASVAFTACSSDGGDEDGGNGGGTGGGSLSSTIPTTTPKDINGNLLRLKTIVGGPDGNCTLTYDANGVPSQFNLGNEGKVTVNGNKITYTYEASWGNNNWEKINDEYIVTLNSDGLVTGIAMTTKEEIQQTYFESAVTQGSVTFSYNGQKQLVKITGTGTTHKEEDGEKWSYQTTFTQTNTWNNGNLTKTEVVANYTGGGQATTTFTYTYGSLVNTTKQYPYRIADSAINLGEGMAVFALLGYFGVGPANLPTSYTEKLVENYSGEAPFTEENTYTTSYTLNSNGSIATEKEGNQTITYTYTTISDDNNSNSGTASDLVGTWRISKEDGVSMDGTNGTWFIFNANGKGYEEDHYPGETERWPITWSYDASKKTLTVVDVEDPKDTVTDVWEVVSFTSTKLVMRIHGNEFEFIKVN